MEMIYLLYHDTKFWYYSFGTNTICLYISADISKEDVDYAVTELLRQGSIYF
jgi:hypothetical protein